jgi:GDP-4-dehydro-6-deoxy-D-mannose reductase
MRVLITGASGFLGRRLVRRLAARGDTVVGTTLGDTVATSHDIETMELDVRDAAAVRHVIQQTDPELVVHLAGLTHVGSSWNRMAEYYQVNVEGTAHVVDAASNRCLVFASSAEVYGQVPESDQPIVETVPVAPRSPYALTKAAAELMVRGVGGRILRLFNVVGPGQSNRFALPSFAQQLKAISRGSADGGLRVGNLEARRDFTHVEDAVEGFLLVADRGDDGGTYNLGSGKAYSIREALELLMEVAGISARVTVDPGRLRPVDVPLLQADAGRLRELGWSPQRDLRQALTELWASVDD